MNKSIMQAYMRLHRVYLLASRPIHNSPKAVPINIEIEKVNYLQLVVVVLVARNVRLETLALPHVLDDLTRQSGLVEHATAGENLPVVEH